ncbi:MAG: TonB-dependent receptor, partial [Ignavibacteriales bacterium]|nr:TonB-dependent receptor [Ignavibacteriales bacterium]
LPGANVVVLGTPYGAATTANGSYRIRVASGSYEIQVSLIGHNTLRQKITVGENQTVTKDFTLEDNLIGLGEVVVTGTRSSDRTVIESPVPIDVIGAREIQTTGFTQTTQILKMLIPSYNAPQPSITDGTDHVRPATLRGLGPDQVLILVNGKRRHTSALVHVNGSVGRGSTGVDLNAIPVSSIERVEVLRDGAAAQYGSDAISGVINIILKQDVGFNAGINYGQYMSTTDRGYSISDGNRTNETTNFAAGTWDGQRFDADGKKQSTSYSDGKSTVLHAGYGLPFGDGSIYLSGEYTTHGATNRAGIDPRTQYSGSVPGNENTFDPLGQGVRINHKYGDGEFTDATLFLNASRPLEGGVTVYAFGGYASRHGKSAGFYRRANDARNVPQIYPNGFLPYIETDIIDFSLAAGLKGSVGGWTYDISETYGTNSLKFRVTNSLNTSFWTKSPTEFDAGTLKFSQATTNIDFFRSVDMGWSYPLNIAVGAEYRAENYKILEGQFESYALGDSASKAAGAQVFPGFSPSNKQDQTRSNVGLYVDLENKLTPVWMMSVAGRFESYSDFGSTVTGKLATRYDLGVGFALRGAISTGFRAPSLAQSYFSAISTNFISGVPYEIGTFPVNTPVAKALGAKDLQAEKSVNFSAGLTYNVANASVTVDAYQIDIKDRIVFTENFVESTVRSYLQTLGINAAGGRYFTNAVNTTTRGLDITARYGFTLGDASTLRLIAAINFNKTEITNKDAIVTPAVLQAVSKTPLFGRIEQGRFEVGQPQSTYNLMANYSFDAFELMLRTVRFGDVSAFNDNTDLTRDQTFAAKWITDGELSYHLRGNLTLAVGSNNIFDIYPDKQLKTNSTSGILQYSGLSPFGFNGRYVYSRISYTL